MQCDYEMELANGTVAFCTAEMGHIDHDHVYRLRAIDVMAHREAQSVHAEQSKRIEELTEGLQLISDTTGQTISAENRLQSILLIAEKLLDD